MITQKDKDLLLDRCKFYLSRLHEHDRAEAHLSLAIILFKFIHGHYPPDCNGECILDHLDFKMLDSDEGIEVLRIHDETHKITDFLTETISLPADRKLNNYEINFYGGGLYGLLRKHFKT